MTTPRKRTPWSHWDRFLFIVLGVVFTLVLGLGFWFRELDKTPDLTVPTPTPLADNAFGYDKAAADAIVDSDKISYAISTRRPSSLPKPAGIGTRSSFGRPGSGGLPGGASSNDRVYTLSQKAALVSENGGAVEILHEGFRYPYQEPPARSFSATFPEYAKMRGLARLLLLRAQVEAAQGDWGASLNSDLDAVQLGEEMPHGGPFIGTLVGAACQSIGRRPAWAAIDHLTAPQARAAAGRLERIRADHVPFSATMQEEEWEGQASLLELMRSRE